MWSPFGRPEPEKSEPEAGASRSYPEPSFAHVDPDEQAELAAVEVEKVEAVQRDVSTFQQQCHADLSAAEPAIKKAEAALSGLDKNALVELKSLSTPPKEVLTVAAAVAYMTARKGVSLKKLDVSWAGIKKLMASVDGFLASLQTFDKDNFPAENKEWVRRLTGQIGRAHV